MSITPSSLPSSSEGPKVTLLAERLTNAIQALNAILKVSGDQENLDSTIASWRVARNKFHQVVVTDDNLESKYTKLIEEDIALLQEIQKMERSRQALQQEMSQRSKEVKTSVEGVMEKNRDLGIKRSRRATGEEIQAALDLGASEDNVAGRDKYEVEDMKGRIHAVHEVEEAKKSLLRRLAEYLNDNWEFTTQEYSEFDSINPGKAFAKIKQSLWKAMFEKYPKDSRLWLKVNAKKISKKIWQVNQDEGSAFPVVVTSYDLVPGISATCLKGSMLTVHKKGDPNMLRPIQETQFENMLTDERAPLQLKNLVPKEEIIQILNQCID